MTEDEATVLAAIRRAALSTPDWTYDQLMMRTEMRVLDALRSLPREVVIQALEGDAP